MHTSDTVGTSAGSRETTLENRCPPQHSEAAIHNRTPNVDEGLS